MSQKEGMDPGLARFLNEVAKPILDRVQGWETVPDPKSLLTVEYELQTAEQLIMLFDRHPMFRAPGGIEARATGTNQYIFRGQADHRWPLLPSSLRWDDKELDHVRGLVPSDVTAYVKSQLIDELIAIKDFLLLAASLGFAVPIGPEELYEYMLPIETAALSGKVPELPPLPPQILDAMALAQHHGVKTRLLDWSESPYVAAFFAAFELSAASGRTRQDLSDRMIVYCLNGARLGSYPRIRKYIPQRHNKDFVRVQRGIFIHFSAIIDRFLERQAWPSLSDIVKDPGDHVVYVNEWPALVLYTLPSAEADPLLRILYNRNVSLATLMPNLDNIAADRSYAQRLFGD